MNKVVNSHFKFELKVTNEKAIVTENIWINTFKSEHYQRQLWTKTQFMYGKYVFSCVKCFPYVKITKLSPLVWNTFYWMCMCIGNDIGHLAQSVRFHILTLLGGWFIETNVLIVFFLLILIILIPSQNPISGDADKRQDRNKCPLLGVPKRECWLWCQISHYESTER